MNKKTILLALLFIITQQQVHAFCGFYVARADVKLFNKTSQYLTTNLDTSKITYLTTSVLTNNYNGDIDFRMVQGKVVQGAKYAEFIVDDIALYELILDVFYNKET